MGKLIYTGGKCKNPKKKPGWQAAAAQEAEWLKGLQSVKLFGSKRKFGGKVKVGVKVSPVVDGRLPIERPAIGQSLGGFVSGGAGTKPVHRPEITYKDDPELLKRELKARERKFATAPAYNKGGDVLVTDEMMKDITAGKTRRR